MNCRGLIMAGALAMAAFSAGAAADAPRLFALDQVVDSEDSNTIRDPTGVAAASDTELAVVDARGNRLIVFRFSGVEWTEQQTVNLPGTPLAIAHDGTRYLVSLRQGKGLMAVEGERNQLRPVALPAGAVSGVVAGAAGGGFLVHDSAGHQVLRLSRDGKVEGRIPVEAGVVGLAAGRGGSFFASRPAAGEILEYDAAGKLSDRRPVPGVEPVPAWPVSMVQIDGELVVLDRHGHRLVVLDSRSILLGIGARRGWEQGLLLFPAAVAAFPDGRVAVADQRNGRVQIFRRIEEQAAP